MKKKSIFTSSAPSDHDQSEGDIRNYAYHLYQQGGFEPGHDLDNWLEATACLKARIPAHQSATRLHHLVNRSERGEVYATCPEAINLAS